MHSPESQTEEFALPPVVYNQQRRVRKAGFELEYTGINIETSARLVQEVFGGKREAISTFVQHVHTPRGTFQCEIDAAMLKDKKYEAPIRAIGLDPAKMDTRWLEETLLGVASVFVPVEIGAPPVPVTELAPLDELRRRLAQAGAKGDPGVDLLRVRDAHQPGDPVGRSRHSARPPARVPAALSLAEGARNEHRRAWP